MRFATCVSPLSWGSLRGGCAAAPASRFKSFWSPWALEGYHSMNTVPLLGAGKQCALSALFGTLCQEAVNLCAFLGLCSEIIAAVADVAFGSFFSRLRSPEPVCALVTGAIAPQDGERPN